MLRCQEFLPHPALREIILHYGVLEDDEIYREEKIDVTPPVINKGLMFHYRRETKLIIDNGHFIGELPRGFILPQGSTPNVWKHRGGFGIFSVIFKPGRFRYLYQDSMFEHLNGAPTFEDLNNKELLELKEQIMIASTHRCRVKLANQFFIKKMRYLHVSQDTMQESLRQMYLTPQLNIKAIQEETPFCEGHFRRVFSRTFGIAPKKMQKLIRLTHAVNQLTGRPNKNLAQIALDCGFSDQAHFTKQFRLYTGQTPLAFRKEQLNMTQLITHRDDITDGMFR